jgi:hypothetical protein
MLTYVSQFRLNHSIRRSVSMMFMYVFVMCYPHSDLLDYRKHLAFALLTNRVVQQRWLEREICFLILSHVSIDWLLVFRWLLIPTQEEVHSFTGNCKAEACKRGECRLHCRLLLLRIHWSISWLREGLLLLLSFAASTCTRAAIESLNAAPTLCCWPKERVAAQFFGLP